MGFFVSPSLQAALRLEERKAQLQRQTFFSYSKQNGSRKSIGKHLAIHFLILELYQNFTVVVVVKKIESNSFPVLQYGIMSVTR